MGTIFCIVRANKETLEYARSVRKIVTNMRHSGCKSIETMCQACQLRQTQRNIIRFSSSSGTSSSSDDGESRKIKFKKKSSDYRRESKNTVRKLSQEEVRKSLQKKLESTESGLSSGQSGKNIVGIQKNTSSVQQKPEKTSSAKPISSNKRRVSTPIIVLNSSKIREKTKIYEEKQKSLLESRNSGSNLSVTPPTSGICTTASSSNTTSRCASSESGNSGSGGSAASNASTEKTRTVKQLPINNKKGKQEDVCNMMQRNGVV